jgi:maestro heat-like repeat-containing protein family member 1
MPDKVPSFIESCLPYLRSHWNEIRSHACMIIGLLHHYGGKLIEDEKYRVELETLSSEKISACLKDEQISVRIKAADSLGYLFSEPS